jgi:hypothetical protein
MRMRPLIPRLEILARLLMSGFGSLADIRTAKSHVRFTPQEEISETRYLSFTATSFNRLTPRSTKVTNAFQEEVAPWA